MSSDYSKKIKEAADWIRKSCSEQPEILLILGSGLGVLADEVEEAVKFGYDDIPYFPSSSVEGHHSQMVFGNLMNRRVGVMQGRVHYYEGYTMRDVTFPLRVMIELGGKALIVTSACGGLNPSFYPGALVFVHDHINLMGDNPLIGENDDTLGPRFPDMSEAYNSKLIEIGHEVSKTLNIETFMGIHTAISGPNYLSPAELDMVRGFKSDTIGMSMIPETIVAVHAGIPVLGIACVTDMALPGEQEPLTHERVVSVARQSREKFKKLVCGILEKMPV